MSVWLYGSSSLLVEAVATLLTRLKFDVSTAPHPPAQTEAALWLAWTAPRNIPTPNVRQTLVLIDAERDVLVSLLARGYRGYVSTEAPPSVLKDAMKAVASGSVWAPRELMAHALSSIVAVPGPAAAPTPREREVLALISKALSNRAIADKLGITERTVKAHVSSLLTKYQVRSRVELVVNAGVGRDKQQSRDRDRAA